MLLPGNLVHELDVKFLLGFPVLFVLSFLEFFEDLNLAVGFDQDLSSPFRFFRDLLQLLGQLLSLGANNQFVAVLFEQFIDIDLSRLA